MKKAGFTPLLIAVIVVSLLISFGASPGMSLAQNNSTLSETRNAPDRRLTPSIKFTYVPPYGSFKDLTGRAYNVTYSQYRVAVYINVNGGWWTKPYWSNPTRPLDSKGKWSCDITTGGIDERATGIIAFLIPKSYSPPLMSGGAVLPKSLYRRAVAYTQVTRNP